MPWTKYDDGFHEHPKTVAMSDKAFRLFVCSTTYASRHRLNGRLDERHLAVLFRLTGAKQKHVEELIANRSYDRDGAEVLIHDFEDYNPNEEERLKRSESGRAGGLKSGEARRSKREALASEVEASASENRSKDEANAKQTRSSRGGYPDPDPYPDPVPDPSGEGEAPSAHTRPPTLKAFLAHAGRAGVDAIAAEKCWNHHEIRGWPNGGAKWDLVLKNWHLTDVQKQQESIPSRSGGGYSRSGFKCQMPASLVKYGKETLGLTDEQIANYDFGPDIRAKKVSLH